MLPDSGRYMNPFFKDSCTDMHHRYYITDAMICAPRPQNHTVIALAARAALRTLLVRS
eukprot:COSAG02_NODE_1230_length_13767_cov_16.238294_13_plen_58_part_00